MKYRVIPIDLTYDAIEKVNLPKAHSWMHYSLSGQNVAVTIPPTRNAGMAHDRFHWCSIYLDNGQAS